jgi:hypothetical protein
MVHLAPLLLFTSLCMVVSGLGTEKRDFKGVQSSLDTIITQAGVVKGKVASFPNSGGTLPQAVVSSVLLGRRHWQLTFTFCIRRFKAPQIR